MRKLNEVGTWIIDSKEVLNLIQDTGSRLGR